jgi:hypothetical protein
MQRALLGRRWRSFRHEQLEDLAVPAEVIRVLELRECLSRSTRSARTNTTVAGSEHTSSLASLLVMPVMCTCVLCRTLTFALFCIANSASLRLLSRSFFAACNRFILCGESVSLGPWDARAKDSGTDSSGLIALNSTVASS